MKRSVQTSAWPLPNQGVRFITPPRLRRALARHPLGQACYPLALGYYPEAHGHHMQRRAPDDNLLIYCRAGRGWLECAGERVEVGGGDLLVLPKGREHAYGADSQRPWSIYWVHFEGGLAEDFLRPLGSAPRLRLGMQPRLLAEFDALLALRRQGLSLPHFIHAAHLLQGLLTSLAVRPARASLKSGRVLDIDAVQALMRAHLHDSLNLDEELAKLDEFELNQEFSSIEKAPRPAESLLARRDDERDPHDERWAEALIADAEPAQPARGNPRQEPSLGEPLAEERVSFVPLRRAEDPPELRLSLDDDDDDEPSLGKRRHGLSVLDEDDEESAEEQSVAPLGSARKPDEAPVESLDQLRDEPLQLAWEKPRRQWPRRLGWLLLILLALGGLAAQYIAYHFDELARQDAYRPWFAQLCPEIGCTLPSKVDVEQIRSSNLVVRSHPEFSGALVVDAIIYNRASFSQPFPLLELRFADLNGHLIANRRFKPGEYLGGELAGRTEMPPQVPIHVSLDILDPGPKAVNYSLSFHSPE